MVEFHPFWTCCLSNRLHVLQKEVDILKWSACSSPFLRLKMVFHVNETIYRKFEPLNCSCCYLVKSCSRLYWLSTKPFQSFNILVNATSNRTVLNVSSFWMMSSLMAAGFTPPSQIINLVPRVDSYGSGKHCPKTVCDIAPEKWWSWAYFSVWDCNFSSLRLTLECTLYTPET